MPDISDLPMLHDVDADYSPQPPLFSADWQLSGLPVACGFELEFRVVAGEWRVHLMGEGDPRTGTVRPWR